jgi:hypothetical protein
MNNNNNNNNKRQLLECVTVALQNEFRIYYENITGIYIIYNMIYIYVCVCIKINVKLHVYIY